MVPNDPTFKIGPFRFSRLKGLWHGRQPVQELRHQERQLLKCLLNRPGEIVRKEEIRAALWPDTTVSDNTLNVVVRRLRLLLRDTKRPYRLLKSYPKMGFMIVASPVARRHASDERSPAPGDRSRFVRDVTIPDGSIFGPNEQFEKVWEIQNVGSVAWNHRSIQRVGTSSGVARLVSEPSTPIPNTKPGELCLVRTMLIAPRVPGTYYAQWKMIDAQGNLCFPKQHGPLYVNIDVVIDPE